MRIKSIRCGICHDWHRFNIPCHSCGAIRVQANGKTYWYNRKGLEVVRGFFAPLHEVISQNWSQSLEERG